MSVTIGPRLVVNVLARLAGALVMLVACAAHAQTGAPTQLGVAPAGAPQQIAPSAEPVPPPAPSHRPGAVQRDRPLDGQFRLQRHVGLG